MAAVDAVIVVNRITQVDKDWTAYWRRWVDSYSSEIKTRRGRTKEGKESNYRREIEVGSFFRAIVRHWASIEKALGAKSPELRRREAVRAKLEQEYSILTQTKQQILDGAD
jgi:hypothetical protein